MSAITGVDCIGLSPRFRQIIDVRDIAKSRYFAITEFNDYFVTQLPSFCFDKYLREAAIFTRERLQEEEKRVFF